MKTKTITVRVNVEAAHIFEKAPEEEKCKIEALQPIEQI